MGHFTRFEGGETEGGHWDKPGHDTHTHTTKVESEPRLASQLKDSQLRIMRSICGLICQNKSLLNMGNDSRRALFVEQRFILNLRRKKQLSSPPYARKLPFNPINSPINIKRISSVSLSLLLSHRHRQTSEESGLNLRRDRVKTLRRCFEDGVSRFGFWLRRSAVYIRFGAAGGAGFDVAAQIVRMSNCVILSGPVCHLDRH